MARHKKKRKGRKGRKRRMSRKALAACRRNLRKARAKLHRR